jgi:acetyl/propionyl-CoA carboxylase alpha subunit
MSQSTAVALAAVLRFVRAAHHNAFGSWIAWSSGSYPPATLTLANVGDGTIAMARIVIATTTRFAVTVGDAVHHVEIPPDFDPHVARTRVVLDDNAHAIAYAEAEERCYIAIDAETFAFDDLARVPAIARREASGDGIMRAPTSGKVINVRVRSGERVERGAVAIVLHAMKMEHAITVTRSGTVREVAVRIGDQVSPGTLLVALEPDTISQRIEVCD